MAAVQKLPIVTDQIAECESRAFNVLFWKTNNTWCTATSTTTRAFDSDNSGNNSLSAVANHWPVIRETGYGTAASEQCNPKRRCRRRGSISKVGHCQLGFQNNGKPWNVQKRSSQAKRGALTHKELVPVFWPHCEQNKSQSVCQKDVPKGMPKRPEWTEANERCLNTMTSGSGPDEEKESHELVSIHCKWINEWNTFLLAKFASLSTTATFTALDSKAVLEIKWKNLWCTLCRSVGSKHSPVIITETSDSLPPFLSLSHQHKQQLWYYQSSLRWVTIIMRPQPPFIQQQSTTFPLAATFSSSTFSIFLLIPLFPHSAFFTSLPIIFFCSVFLLCNSFSSLCSLVNLLFFLFPFLNCLWPLLQV